MANGKRPPYDPVGEESRPPESIDRSRDRPGVNEYEPPRNRNVPARAVTITVVLVLLLGLLYFLVRG